MLNAANIPSPQYPTNTTIFQELEEILIKEGLRGSEYDWPLYISPDIYYMLYWPASLAEVKERYSKGLEKIDLLYLDKYTSHAYLGLMPFTQEGGLKVYNSEEEAEEDNERGYVLLYQDGPLRILGAPFQWVC